MAVIPAVSEITETSLAVPLPLYSQLVGYDEAAFFGIVRQDPPAVHSNKPLWNKSERDMVAHYLREAQDEIEQVTRYPLAPRWFAAEEHDYQYPILTRWTRVIEVGIEASTAISAGAAVNHATDPAVVGPIVTTVTDEDEIKVYRPGTIIEINPSDITIAAGSVTIEIPRARLLTEDAYAETDGVDYNDTGVGGSFLLTVDVARVFNDDTTQATLRWPHGTSTDCCLTCSGTTATGCAVIVNADVGEIDILPATESGGTWTRSFLDCYCHYPERVQINYRAGLTELTNQARDAIVRLAHAKMPHDPCNVSPPNWMWTHDTEIPRALTKERLNCKFGLQNGAWTAYQFALSMRMVRGSTL